MLHSWHPKNFHFSTGSRASTFVKDLHSPEKVLKKVLSSSLEGPGSASFRSLLHFGLRLTHRERCKAWVGHRYGGTPEGPSAPEEKREKGNLPKLSSVFSDREHLDTRLDTFTGPGRLPELEIQPGTASLIITFYRLRIKE
jgi:hypothetical protein